MEAAAGTSHVIESAMFGMPRLGRTDQGGVCVTLSDQGRRSQHIYTGGGAAVPLDREVRLLPIAKGRFPFETMHGASGSIEVRAEMDGQFARIESNFLSCTLRVFDRESGDAVAAVSLGLSVSPSSIMSLEAGCYLLEDHSSLSLATQDGMQPPLAPRAKLKDWAPWKGVGAISIWDVEGDCSLRVWEDVRAPAALSEQKVKLERDEEVPNMLALSDDGTRLAVGADSSRVIRFYEVPSLKLIERREEEHDLNYGMLFTSEAFVTLGRNNGERSAVLRFEPEAQ